MNNTHRYYSRGSLTADIPDNQLCTVYQCNHVIDVISIQKRSHSISNYKKVSKSFVIRKPEKYLSTKSMKSVIVHSKIRLRSSDV